VLVLVLTGVLAWRGALRAEAMREVANPDRISLYVRTILLEWLELGLVLVGVWRKGLSVLTVLGEHWSSVRSFLRDLGIGLAFLVTTITVTSILAGHHHNDQATQFLLPQGARETALWLVVSLTAGICEEAVYRGYFQKQFIAFTKNVPAGIVLSALAFGAGHAYQGVGRALVIVVLGMMSGILAHWCRSVRPGMIAHALQDMLGAVIRH